jgi:hypothetical protein
MEVSQDTSLQEATSREEAQGDARQELAASEGAPDPSLILSQAFVNGFAIHGEAPAPHRARAAYIAIQHPLVEDHNPMVLRLVEAVGTTEGLYAKIYKRRDRLWMKYDVKVKRWSKRLSMTIPADMIGPAVDKAYREAPADTKRQREEVKAVIYDYLLTMLKREPELSAELRSMAAAGDAEGTAEGQAAAAALQANKDKQRVPDLPRATAAYLRVLQADEDYGKNAPKIQHDMLQGLAGDAAISYVALANQAQQSDPSMWAAIVKAIGAGAGASFFLDMHIHASFALAMLALYAAAEPRALVDFTTVGDERVCPLCTAAEDGNPYKPGDVPPIPLHGGCRCWYTPADE